MGFSSLPWPFVGADDECGADAVERALALWLERGRRLGSTSALFVDPRPSDRRLLRLARDHGARVTALCAADRAADACAGGAEFVMDPRVTDPTWYRGAWSVIVDPDGRLGFRRARPALVPCGVYLTASPSARHLARSLASLLGGGPRVARLPR